VEDGEIKLNEVYNQMCVDEKMKEEFKHLESKGLIHTLHFSQNLKTSWIRLVLIQVHDMYMWLDTLVKITKDVIHMVTRYPLIDKVKTIRIAPKEEIEENTKSKWDNKGI